MKLRMEGMEGTRAAQANDFQVSRNIPALFCGADIHHGVAE